MPVLVTTLKHKDVGLRLSAALALRQIDPSTKEAVTVIVTALNHTDPMIRQRAVGVLGVSGYRNRLRIRESVTVADESITGLRFEAK